MSVSPEHYAWSVDVRVITLFNVGFTDRGLPAGTFAPTNFRQLSRLGLLFLWLAVKPAHLIWNLLIWVIELTIFNSANVTTNIKLQFLFEAVYGHSWLDSTFFQDYCMHPIDWTGFTALFKKFLTANGTCNDVAHKWVALGQVSGEVHFFPGRMSAWKLTTCTSFWFLVLEIRSQIQSSQLLRNKPGHLHC